MAFGFLLHSYTLGFQLRGFKKKKDRVYRIPKFKKENMTSNVRAYHGLGHDEPDLLLQSWNNLINRM